MSFYAVQNRKKFVDEFVHLERPVPDLALCALIDVQQNGPDPVVRQIYDDLLTCYSLGSVIPAIGGVNGLKWSAVDPS